MTVLYEQREKVGKREGGKDSGREVGKREEEKTERGRPKRERG